MDKHFGLARFHEVLLFSSIKHLSKCSQNNKSIIQDYQPAEIIDGSILNYFSSF